MQLRNSATSYGIIAQLFHWLVAMLVVVQIPLGVYASDLPVSVERLKLLSRHKAIGITVLALVALRFAWRLAERVPALPDSMPSWERRVALATHRLLYLLLLLAPVSGWLHASASGLSVTWFGLFKVPDLLDKRPDLAPYFENLHDLVVYTLVTLIVLHVAAALRHGLLRHDGVMRRILPVPQEENRR